MCIESSEVHILVLLSCQDHQLYQQVQEDLELHGPQSDPLGQHLLCLPVVQDRCEKGRMKGRKRGKRKTDTLKTIPMWSLVKYCKRSCGEQQVVLPWCRACHPCLVGHQNQGHPVLIDRLIMLWNHVFIFTCRLSFCSLLIGGTTTAQVK